MNYIELINNFWELDETWQFTCCETRLYFYLLKTANRLGWVDSWTHSDVKMSANVGVSVNSFKTARNKLAQAGLISFDSGGKGQGNKSRYQLRCQNLIPNAVRCQNLMPNHIPKPIPKLTPKPIPKVEPKADYTLLDEININKTKTLSHEANFDFENVWSLYGKKGNKKTSEKRWANLKNHCREAALKHIPAYVESTPEIQFRKNFETYLNQEAWNDEIITKTSKHDTNRQNSRISIAKCDYGESTI